MKNLLVSLALISIIIFSCSKDYNISLNKQDVTVNINGFVSDVSNNTPIKGAKVLINSVTLTTDSVGHYSLMNQSLGNYLIKITATGYSGRYDSLNINPNNYSGKTYNANINTSLYKLDQTLTTHLYINVGGVYTSAANAAYTINLGNLFIPNVIKGVANSSGVITQANLPNTYFQLMATTTLNNKTYSGTYNGFTNDSVSDVLLYLQSSNSIFVVTSNNLIDANGNVVTNFLTNQNIVVQFSSAVDTSYSSNIINFYIENPENAKVAFNKSWSSNAKTLTIIPIGNNLEPGATYQFSFTLYSSVATGHLYYSNSFNFTTAGGTTAKLGQVTGISKVSPTAIVANTTLVEIKFPFVTQATQYSVYAKYNNGDYLLLTTLYPYNSSSSTQMDVNLSLINLQGFTVPTGGLFTSSSSAYTIIIRAENSSGIVGPFSSPFSFQLGSK